MGADTSSHLIFFIAATVVAVSASGILAGVVMDLSDKLDVKGREFGSTLTTSVKIANDPGQVPNDPVKIYVKNTGQTTLDKNLVTLIVDGEIVSEASLTRTVLDGSNGDYWRPGDLLELQYATALAAGDHRVRVMTGNGVHDDMNFRV